MIIADNKSDNPVLKALEHKFARFGQIVICPRAAGRRAGLERRRGFVLVAQRSVGPADALLVQKREPLFALGGEHAARAVRAAGSPFGDKHGQPLVHRGGNAVAQPLTVRACVKMTGVHQIRAGNRVVCRVENILTPSARADEDDALRGVCADGLYHGLGIGLDVAASSNVRKKGS